MFQKVEAAPTLFLITILAFAVLVLQIGAGGGDPAAERVDRAGVPGVQLIENLLSDAPAGKEAPAQVALFRTPIALEQPGLPRR
jgi:hypothetical protein